MNKHVLRHCSMPFLKILSTKAAWRYFDALLAKPRLASSWRQLCSLRAPFGSGSVVWGKTCSCRLSPTKGNEQSRFIAVWKNFLKNLSIGSQSNRRAGPGRGFQTSWRCIFAQARRCTFRPALRELRSWLQLPGIGAVTAIKITNGTACGCAWMDGGEKTFTHCDKSGLLKSLHR